MAEPSLDADGKRKSPKLVLQWLGTNLLIPAIMTALSAGVMWGKLNGENDLRDYKMGQLQNQVDGAKTLAGAADSASASLKNEVTKLTSELSYLNASVTRLSTQIDRMPR